jgi:isomerase DpgB
MVKEEQVSEAMSTTWTVQAQLGPEELVLRVDGREPLSAAAISAVGAVCDSAEDGRTPARVIVQVSGSPQGPRPRTHDLTVSRVSRWERALRRLERLPVTTIAIADGVCGGLALDVLLATDYRIATSSVSLAVPVEDGATWPGMALYRLASNRAGAAAIRRAVLFGMPVGASDALALQLIDELTDDVPSALATAAERTGTVSGSELAIRRQLMFDASATSFEDALGAHLAACDRALRRGYDEVPV